MKFAISGPQNTGKTTFIQDFLVHFPHYVSPKETYRDIITKNNLKIDQDATEESQKVIRDFLYRQISKNEKDDVIFDRCIIDSFVYSLWQHELGSFSSSFIAETKAMMLDSINYLDALIFIPTALSVKLVDDNFRDVNHNYIDNINRLFVSVILEIARETKFNIFVVTGDRNTRIEQMRKVLQN